MSLSLRSWVLEERLSRPLTNMCPSWFLLDHFLREFIHLWLLVKHSKKIPKKNYTIEEKSNGCTLCLACNHQYWGIWYVLDKWEHTPHGSSCSGLLSVPFLCAWALEFKIIIPIQFGGVIWKKKNMAVRCLCHLKPYQGLCRCLQEPVSLSLSRWARVPLHRRGPWQWGTRPWAAAAAASVPLPGVLGAEHTHRPHGGRDADPHSTLPQSWWLWEGLRRSKCLLDSRCNQYEIPTPGCA